MNRGRITPTVAIILLSVAIAFLIWRVAFQRDDSMNFSTKDLPADMKTTTPPPQISGVIPRRSPKGSAEEFTGGAVGNGKAAQGPPGRR